jgi:hypothetical protein
MLAAIAIALAAIALATVAVAVAIPIAVTVTVSNTVATTVPTAIRSMAVIAVLPSSSSSSATAVAREEVTTFNSVRSVACAIVTLIAISVRQGREYSHKNLVHVVNVGVHVQVFAPMIDKLKDAAVEIALVDGASSLAVGDPIGFAGYFCLRF